VPAFDGGDDFVGVCCPYEGLWGQVCFGEESVDGLLEIGDGSEDAALQTLFGQLGKVPFHGIEPGTRCRREVEDEALVPVEPGAHLGMLVRCVVVENDMDDFSGRNLGLDCVQEADELLMTVPLHVAADDGSVEHVEGGKQGRGAVALVVVSHRSSPALLHRQARLGAVERLDLAFLVKRQDDGVGGRIDIKPHDFAQFLDEVGIVGELEVTEPVRLQPVRMPDALNRTGADTDLIGHHRGGPMRRFGRRIGLGQRHNALGDLCPQWRNARGACLVVQQAVEAFRHEAFLPAPDAGLRFAGLPHDLVGADAGSRQKDDLGSPHMLLRTVAISRHSLQTAADGRRNREGYSCAHPTDSHAPHQTGIPNGIQLSEFIH